MRSDQPVSDVLEQTAADIRRLITRRVLGFMERGEATQRGLVEALTLAHHIRPGQHEAAIIAHRTLVRVVRGDLASLGVAEEEYLRIANLLVDYLYCSGFELDAGTWREAPAAAVAPGPRLVEAG